MTVESLFSSSLIAAVVTVVLGLALRWQEQSQKARAFLRGILLEIEHAELCAQEYLKNSIDNSWSPANRIILNFTQMGLPVLIESGHMLPGEVEKAHRFSINSTEANRCLDELAEIRRTVPPARNAQIALHIRETLLTGETSRTRIKMQNVLDSIPSFRDATKAALERINWFEST